ncbi:hypothetical protein L484_005910 [Morus notabilis]|uniref:Queuosine 5'-phosphate N-glycosylase/hydrolase n=1 Tax=Morus notabilis TaxID=981085 RepID=W9QJ26_9ROSA|nr:hypothetical protein L484_005910 [Morus notabilis]
MDDVRASSAWVASRSSHVVVDSLGVEKVVENIGSIPRVKWDFEGIHYFDNGPLTVQYLLVLDALNFCFWPDADLNYDHLASGLKEALQNDKSVFDADRLQKYTAMTKTAMVGAAKDASSSEVADEVVPQSPMYLPDHSLQITIHKLNGKNYVEWSQFVKLVIDGKGKLGYLTGEIKQHTDDAQSRRDGN